MFKNAASCAKYSPLIIIASLFTVWYMAQDISPFYIAEEQNTDIKWENDNVEEQIINTKLERDGVEEQNSDKKWENDNGGEQIINTKLERDDVEEPNIDMELEIENVEEQIIEMEFEGDDVEEQSINLEGDDVRNRFAMRNIHLKEQCHKLYGATNETTGSSADSIVDSQILMTKDYNLLACINSKAGTGTYHHHFDAINHFKKKRYPSKAKYMITLDEIKRRMLSKDFIKILSVRHPLIRLVSTYRVLFADGKGRIPASSIRAVVGKYLPKGTGVTNITFSQYLEAIVAQWKLDGKANKHWLTYYSHCLPCVITYDYIIKMDTLAEDLEYVLETAGINSTSLDLNSNLKSNITEDKKDAYLDYYRGVDETLLQGMYDVYEEDFKLFDYELPEFLKRVIMNKT